MVINAYGVPSYNCATNRKAKYSQKRSLFKYSDAVLKTLEYNDLRSTNAETVRNIKCNAYNEFLEN